MNEKANDTPNESASPKPPEDGEASAAAGEAPVKKEPKKVPPKKAAAEGAPAAAEGAAPAKAEAKPEPKPIEPGVFCKFLQSKGFHPTPLAPDAGGMETIELKPDELRDAALCLRDGDEARFDLLLSVSGMDYKTHRMAVYHLYSTKTYQKLALKVSTSDDKIPSVVPVWQGADWHEREAFDLFGITFDGHPDLRRILMPSDWIGFPMRKDYKVDDPRLVWNER